MLKKIGIFFVLTVLFFASIAGYLWWQIPSEKTIKGCVTTKMFQVNLCPGSKNYVPLRQISSHLQKAIVLTEDSGFWNHKGFDWESIEKSARENWEKGEYKRGGSTITQQLAKNMFLSKDKSLFRKGLEALITNKIEKTLTKREILERYLNVVEFGKNIYGVKEASQFYFKKGPGSLSVVEAAFLAMVLPSPEKYSRSFFKKELTPFARKRISQIVNNMYRYNRISQTEYDIAMTEVDQFLREGLAQEPPPELGIDSDTTTLEQLEIPDSEEDNFY